MFETHLHGIINNMDIFTWININLIVFKIIFVHNDNNKNVQPNMYFLQIPPNILKRIFINKTCSKNI